MRFNAIPIAELYLFLGVQLMAGQSVFVRGEVVCPSHCGHLQVQLRNSEQPGSLLTSWVAPSGAFDFQRVSSGMYQITVADERGDPIKNDFIHVTEPMASLRISIEGRPGAARSNGTISARRLAHKPSKQVRKLLSEAQKQTERGDLSGAATTLQQAIAIDPESLESHNNLGAIWMRMGNLQAALRSFDAAAAIDPGAPSPQVNRGLALLRLGDYGAAEGQARLALRSQPRGPAPHLVLGLAMFARRTWTDEMLDSLRAACEQFPNTRMALAQALAARGEHDAARSELEAYMKLKNADRRSEAAAMLKSLP